ncbi:MAG: hypothetical protein A2268_08270 [Candidatus Raymondbacteria bacterium RifOxyA12_full_50_37]|uniref:Uncharacterized protein n=1 Tax=Candidatus Raymondbacteria bacterium RIFOXYD12_FULL_49_13 TaxID=1817890 RepID=A0A1F7FEZ5_UNCRA|nr:MAG: hypothetical protein A2268_08270 [Candidatus Raymondbacteria bacterium RifOxyA12_full_50_37]OGJ92850.1 MAG: hypothetical protein A2248_07060 [Candidatus Raymondbacteria bacterium RIFOXYA2_FULL_49_16]OGJ94123.1 MAG: hypothetical protein A2487_16280 [Candidatus Raymondbacteria bacterium RifOxyC12_full_50_8]OGJ99142.1 MAG: hypothetical protein A2453_09205 [Candidatus Raymondbacteria bacterium RIFOXYC2_FULL_50_21]OGK05269.1 MAG: hypothetical protein A2519_02730 [Candidatus Raymondbacteria b
MAAFDPPPRQLSALQGANVWVGTDGGLYKYQTDNELWSVVGNEPLNDLYLDEDMLWTATNRGVAYADLRYLDWKEYTSANGLPFDTVVSIRADLDYVYAAGKRGCARMDKLVEQWVSIGDFSATEVRDLYSDQDNLWVATANGVQRFYKQYEKWEFFTEQNGLIASDVYRLFYFKGYLWALTSKGFSRYSDKMKMWNSYGTKDGLLDTAVTAFFCDASYIWVVTSQGVCRFNGANEAWERFSANTPLEKQRVADCATSGTLFWFTTDQGVYQYNDDARQWVLYTAMDGLGAESQERILAFGRSAICWNQNVFSVYRTTEDLWFSKELANAGGGRQGARTWKVSSDENGLGATAPSGQRLNLIGRGYFKMKSKAEFPSPVDKSVMEYITGTRLDSAGMPRFKDFMYWWTKAQLNLNGDLGNERTMRGAYDNTDPRGDLKYGMEYRGNRDDNIRRAGWLENQKTDYFFSELIDPTYIEGAGVRTQFGQAIGEKKRHRTTSSFYGGYHKTRYVRVLVPYRKDNFYELKYQNIIIESVELRVDGDLMDPKEYSIERTMGMLTFQDESRVNPDSRIEITFEYEPSLTENTGEYISGEEVVAINDHLAMGATGVYRGENEPSATGGAIAKNRVWAGNVNGEIEFKSSDNSKIFRAYPEISGSYQDSILAVKQGNAAHLRMNTVYHDLRVEAEATGFTPNYESVLNRNSIFGRTKNQASAEAVYDIRSDMPFTAGFSRVAGEYGTEEKEYAEYLVSPAGKPSLKLGGMRQNIRNLDALHNDSLVTDRLNARVESEWDVSQALLKSLGMNRIWLNASYDLDMISDSLHTGAAVDLEQDRNHNLFMRLRLAPHQKVLLETKQVYRFAERNRGDLWEREGERWGPEFILFSQEFVPGVTLYGKLKLEQAEQRETDDTTSILDEFRFNGNALLVPGVWLPVFNPFQLNIGYNRQSADSLVRSASADSQVTDDFDYTWSLNPSLYFGQDIRFLSRTDISRKNAFGAQTGRGLKNTNDFEVYFRERKTKLLLEYDFTSDDVFDSTGWNSANKRQFRDKWTERWSGNFRTELQVAFGRSTDSSYARDNASSSLLLDCRTQRFVREFRVQERIGPALYDGRLFDFSTYRQSIENKLDISLKAGRNVFVRLLLNLTYLFDERLLKYDMAEFKATAVF